VAGELLIDAPADGVVRLRISNPAKRGALDQPLLDAIVAAVRDVEQRARAVIVTGTGGMFSSGYDIGDPGQGSDEEVAEQAQRMVAHPFTAAIDALDGCALPIVAALGGHTIGGGLELAVACDLRVAADGIALGMPPARLGLVYSHTGLRRFIDTIGVARTRQLFLLGRTIDAAAAEQWGLVNTVVAGDDVDATALDWATQLAANAPLSVRGIKRVIRQVLASQAELSAEVEEELIELRRASFDSEDMQEGLRAFAQKRPPRWQGR
jgi:enoyl-CoA hydratase/carnithine racemase